MPKTNGNLNIWPWFKHPDDPTLDGDNTTSSRGGTANSNYDLQITQPRPSADTTHRAYKAYPGIEYTYKTAALGGVFPFAWSLPTFPTGLTIHPTTGVLTWLNPVTLGSPHSATIQLLDDEATVVDVDITLTVTTSGFIFINSAAAAGGDGSLATPYQGWDDFYTARNTANHAAEFAYWYTGTYAYPAAKTYGAHAGSNRLYVTKTYHPHVHLKYPGESPVFDGENATNQIHIRTSSDNAYYHGISFKNGFGHALECQSGNSFQTHECNFEDIINVTAGDNAAAITTLNDTLAGTGGQGNSPPDEATATGLKRWHAHQENTFTNVAILCFECYGLKYNVIADTLFTSCGLSNVALINLKSTVANFEIRGNDFQGTNLGSLLSILAQYYAYDVEVRFNRFNDPGTRIQIGAYSAAAGPKNIFIYRNNINCEFWFRYIDSNDGLVTISKNVVVNESTFTDKMRIRTTDHFSITADVYVLDDNLSGDAADGIFDASGNLQGAYIASHRATHGSEAP